MRLSHLLASVPGARGRLTASMLSSLGCDLATQLTSYHARDIALAPFGLSNVEVDASGAASLVVDVGNAHGNDAQREWQKDDDVVALAGILRVVGKHTRQTPQVAAMLKLARRVAKQPISVGTFAMQLAAIAAPEPVTIPARTPLPVLVAALSWLAVAATGFAIGIRLFQ